MTWTSAKKVRTEAEFQALMGVIDAELAAGRVPIPARQVKALAALRNHLGIQGPIRFSGLPEEPQPDSYDGDDLILRTFRWFAERYRGKLAIPMPGLTFVVIRGEPYLFTVPIVFGRAQFILDPSSMGAKRDSLGRGGPPTFNALDHMTHMTPSLAESLSHTERSEVLRQTVFASTVINRISMIGAALKPQAEELVSQALSDCSGSAEDALRRPADYGGSRWHSLQASEKVLKATLCHRGIKYPTGSKGHDLRVLSIGCGVSTHSRERNQRGAVLKQGTIRRRALHS